MMNPLRILASTLVWLLVAPALAEPDWQDHADVEVVDVLTTDEDGAPREHPIWLVVVDGAAFLRTGGSTWGQNISRTGELTLRIGDAELALAAEAVEDDALRERVNEAFAVKYGFQDRIVSWFRGDRPKIFRLSTPVDPA